MLWLPVPKSDRSLSGAPPIHFVALIPRCSIFPFLSIQVCCKDLWYLEVEPPPQASRVSLVRASTTSLEVSWTATPATNTYILEIQKLPPTASPSPVSTPTTTAALQPQLGTPLTVTGSPVTVLNNAGNVYRLQKPGATVQAQHPLRVVGSPLTAAGLKLGTALSKSPATSGGHQVVSVVKGTQFVSTKPVQRNTTIGGMKQLTSTGSLIQQAGQSGNIVTVSPQQASNLVGQKIVLQKSTLQQFQQQSPGGQKVSVLPAGASAAGVSGGPQIVKLVKTAQGMQVQGATGTKVVNPATGKIIQMPTGQQFFTINKSSGGVTAGGAAGAAQMQKRIITTGPGGQEQQIIVVSQSPSSSIQIRPTTTVMGQAGTAQAGTRGPIKIQTVQTSGGTKQFTIGGKPVTVQLGGVGKKALTIMGGGGTGGAGGASTSGSIINAQVGGQAGQQILILPSGQGQVMHQAGQVLKPGSVLQQGARKSYIQIVGGGAAGQQTVGGQKVLPRIVINQQQLQGGQGGAAGGSSSGGASSSGNIEQVDGSVDGEWDERGADLTG